MANTVKKVGSGERESLLDPRYRVGKPFGRKSDPNLDWLRQGNAKSRREPRDVLSPEEDPIFWNRMKAHFRVLAGG